MRPNLKQLPKRGFDLRQLRAFVATVELGSVSAAAKHLQLAQSTVSEALASLERALGTVLFRHERGTHKLTLTPTGQILEPNARKVLLAVDETFADMADASTSARGAVNIIANESISTYILSPVLAPLRETWRNTKYSVTVGTCNDVRKGLHDLGFDLGLLLERADKRSKVRSAKADRNWWEKRLPINVPIDLVIFAMPEHPILKRKQQLSWDRSALECSPVFISDAAGDFHLLLEDYFRAEGIPGPRLESTGSIEAVKAGVANNHHAIGVLPAYAIVEELRTSRFHALPIRPGLPQMRIVGLLPYPNRPHPSTLELIESIQSFLSIHGLSSLPHPHR